MAKNETTQKTFLVAVVLCFVCSLVVSSAAVLLKPAQVANKALDRKSNILAAAGMLEPGRGIEEQFKQVEPRVVNLQTGTFSDEFAPENLEPLKLAKQPGRSIGLSEDIAGIGRRENYTVVYLVKRDGRLDKIILPVRGYGLWSTLHGFLALEEDANTIAGLGFYEHGETPGLGGEVDNPKWKAQWPGKKVYDEGEVAIRLIKGEVNPEARDAEHKVDGLSGATLTSNGVTNLLRFWLSDMGYRPFLENLRSGEA